MKIFMLFSALFILLRLGSIEGGGDLSLRHKFQEKQSSMPIVINEATIDRRQIVLRWDPVTTGYIEITYSLVQSNDVFHVKERLKDEGERRILLSTLLSRFGQPHSGSETITVTLKKCHSDYIKPAGRCIQQVQLPYRSSGSMIASYENQEW